MSVAVQKQMNPLLAAYLRNLSTNPLRTKAITTGAHPPRTPSLPHAPATEVYRRYLRTALPVISLSAHSLTVFFVSNVSSTDIMTSHPP